jgi:hypothetical protein
MIGRAKMMLFVLRFMNQQTFNGLGKAMPPTVGIQRDNWRGRCRSCDGGTRETRGDQYCGYGGGTRGDYLVRCREVVVSFVKKIRKVP